MLDKDEDFDEKCFKYADLLIDLVIFNDVECIPFIFAMLKTIEAISLNIANKPDGKLLIDTAICELTVFFKENYK
jgi:hypothetical protein